MKYSLSLIATAMIVLTGFSASGQKKSAGKSAPVTQNITTDPYEPKLDSLYRAGKLDEVINFSMPDKEKVTGRSLFFIAMAYYSYNNYASAKKYFDMAIQKGPVHSDMHFFRGELAVKEERTAEAMPDLRKADELQRGVYDYLIALGDAYMQLGKEDSAQYFYEQTISLNNTPGKPFGMLGKIYAKKGMTEDAIAAYLICAERHRKVSDFQKECLYNGAYLEYERQNYDEALRLMYEVTMLDTAYYKGYIGMCMAFIGRKEYKQADSTLWVAVNLMQTNGVQEADRKNFLFDKFKIVNDNALDFIDIVNPDTGFAVVNNFGVLHTFYLYDAQDNYIGSVKVSPVRVGSKGAGTLNYVLNKSGKNYYFDKIKMKDLGSYAEIKDKLHDVIYFVIKPTREEAAN